jgi:hypothetical protein
MVHLHAGVPAPVVAILTIALAHTVLAVMESPGRSCAWRRPCYNLAPPGADFVTHPRYTQPKRRRLRFTEEQRGAATCATPTGGWPAWLLTPPWLPAPRRARPSSMAAASSSDHDPTEASRLRSARPGPPPRRWHRLPAATTPAAAWRSWPTGNLFALEVAGGGTEATSGDAHLRFPRGRCSTPPAGADQRVQGERKRERRRCGRRSGR